MCGLLFYNMMGFALVYWIEGYASEQTSSGFDGSTPAEEFLVLKVPLSLPYHNDWKSAEKTEGVLEQDGDFYQMIEQKLVNDTIYTFCKRDRIACERFFALSSHIKDQIGNNDSHSPVKSSNLLKHFLKDYVAFGKGFLFFIIDWLQPLRKFCDLQVSDNSPEHFNISPPPEQFTLRF